MSETVSANLTVCINLQLERSVGCPFKSDTDVSSEKDHSCFVVCAQVWCAVDELGEVEYKLMGKGYDQVLK